MQSRSFFTFGANYNILVDSPYVRGDSNSNPAPVAVYLTTQDNKDLITENSNNLIAE
jgi:hypothetical protein